MERWGFLEVDMQQTEEKSRWIGGDTSVRAGPLVLEEPLVRAGPTGPFIYVQVISKTNQ